MPDDWKITERTSAAQLFFLVSVVKRAIYRIGGHIRRCGWVYGFVGGVATTLLTLAAIIWFGAFAYPLPWKVIDPADPRFDIRTFRFTDYADSKDLAEVVRHLIPPGTPKDEVDKLLIRAGAHIEPYIPGRNATNPPNLYYYTDWNLRTIFFGLRYMMSFEDIAWTLGVYFDDQDRLVKIVGI